MGTGDRRNQRELPIGRRVAQWRVRRHMTQQMLADRLGKSKSWVDKVERGVRTLDRVSVLHALAEVLRIAPAALLDPAARPPVGVGAVDGVEGVRAALAVPDLARNGRPVVSTQARARQVDHAWLTYQHAGYPQLLRLLPGLLTTAGPGQDDGTGLLVQVYRLTAQVLVKLGEAELGWLAADRAVTTAAGDPLLTAAGTVPLAQALRALDRPRLAHAAALAAARCVAPEVPAPSPARSLQARSLYGTLLVEAALAAADRPDRAGAADLLHRAAGAAEVIGDGHDHGWTGFGPAAVDLARATAAALLGDTDDALDRYERARAGDGWRRLPAEHRAAYLLDVARGCLRTGDVLAAGRLLLDAERTAPTEVRNRPVARDLVTDLVRAGSASAALIRLAADLGAT
ncbi:hypothetical protein AWW66_16740 [Micromonospora rosaria]|uniref:HTH cro/C1-type domain-containing protein n=1 Tax=Micromonospora rosaria TaxID=47874 RepID=A0A136PQZ2_9ACTN|nr:helix-turn-helix transcriptional regulator [Micromonospora rosaria]KXK60841.1 hypothetical protein AWW66_16740 [Micromonospora rosaria]